MPSTLRYRLLPILTLLAVAGGAAAARADDDPWGRGQYTAFGAQSDAQVRKAAAAPAPRIYVPLHTAQPHDVDSQMAPVHATAFGHQPPAATAGKDGRRDVQSAEAPDGGG